MFSLQAYNQVSTKVGECAEEKVAFHQFVLDLRHFCACRRHCVYRFGLIHSIMKESTKQISPTQCRNAIHHF